MRATTSSDQEASTASPAVAVEALARLPEPLTSFIGREREIDELLALLCRPDTRLVTLTGPGGVGKTRLAITLAKTITLTNSTAVTFVSLAPVRDPSLVVSTIGAAFGLSDSGDLSLAERLSTILQDTPILLVLDNFEHLVDAAPLTSLLLSYCPTMKILATSRRPLHVSGEIDYLVPPLETPGPDVSREVIEQSASYRLFVERSPAVMAGADHLPHRPDTVAIGAICSRLDGLPLAIELAAARTRVLPPSELLARLEQRLPLLTGGPLDAPVRLQTMRDAIAWSYDLLNDDEKRLLRTLAMFSGGFTLDAVEAVAPEGLETSALDLLTRLIDHNLVRRMPAIDGPARFTMLETIREFALDGLRTHNEETNARGRHLSWLVVCVGAPGPERWTDLRGPGDFALQGDHHNLRSALKWALQQGDAYRAAQIAWGLLPFWWRHGLNIEGAETLRDIVDQAGTLDPSVLAAMLCRIAEFAHTYGDDVHCVTAATRALALCRDIGQPAGIHDSLYCMGLCSRLREPSASVEWMSQAAEISRATGDDRRLARDLAGRVWAHIALGDPDRVLADTAEALTLFEHYQGQDEMRHDHAVTLVAAAWAYGLAGLIDQADDYARRAFALSREFDIVNGLRGSHLVLSALALTRSDPRLAAKHLNEWLNFLHRDGIKSFGTFGFAQVAMLAQAAGDWHRAAYFAGFADAFWTRSQYPESAWSVVAWNFDLTPSRLALGEVVFVAQFEAGRQLTDAEAFVGASALIVAVQTNQERKTGLTRRESEVLDHLAQGKTNQEIAAELFLGKSTIDTHVSNILAKLGVDSRRAAVRVARERGLAPTIAQPTPGTEPGLRR